MSAEEYEDIDIHLRRVKTTRKTWYFYLIALGHDGDPIFIVDKRRGPALKEGRQRRKKAKVKRFARGQVLLGDKGQLLFALEDGNLPAKKMLKLFRLKIAKLLKRCKKLIREAEVLTLEELEKRRQEGHVEVPEQLASNLDALFDLAESEVEVLAGALGDKDDYSGKVETLKTQLQAAEAAMEQSDETTARRLLQRLLERAPKLAEIAWKRESEDVKTVYLAAREKLQETRVGRDFDLVFDPLLALQRKAVNLHGEGRWVDALDVLEELEDQLQSLAYPDASGEDEGQAYLDELEDMPDLDSEDYIETVSGLSGPALARLSRVTSVGHELQTGARKGFAFFDGLVKAILEDEELRPLPGIVEKLDALRGTLPDLEPVHDEVDRLIEGGGDFQLLIGALLTARQSLKDNTVLSDLETVDLAGPYPVLTTFDNTMAACLKLVS